jgi:hypothetical protein
MIIIVHMPWKKSDIQRNFECRRGVAGRPQKIFLWHRQWHMTNLSPLFDAVPAQFLFCEDSENIIGNRIVSTLVQNAGRDGLCDPVPLSRTPSTESKISMSIQGPFIHPETRMNPGLSDRYQINSEGGRSHLRS